MAHNQQLLLHELVDRLEQAEQSDDRVTGSTPPTS